MESNTDPIESVNVFDSVNATGVYANKFATLNGDGDFSITFPGGITRLDPKKNLHTQFGHNSEKDLWQRVGGADGTIGKDSFPDFLQTLHNHGYTSGATMASDPGFSFRKYVENHTAL